MRLRDFARASFCRAIVIALTLGAAARADEELPDLRTLPCVKACANSTPAVGVQQPLPRTPSEFLFSGETYVEGFVRLQYKINADGHISDIAAISVVGPQKFADVTVEAVKDWIYKPATLNGKAVEVSRTLTMKFVTRVNKFPGGRPAVLAAYDTALKDIKDGKWDEANSLLTEVLAQPKLNFYERGMMGNLTSIIAFKKGDYLEAYRVSGVTFTYAGMDLPYVIKASLLETRLRSALLLGDMVGAQEAADALRPLRKFDHAILKALDDTLAKADSLPAVNMAAKIPDTHDADGSFFGLYRRNFAFQDVKGSLDRFILSCKQRTIESKITAAAEWHVPESWSDCRVLVYGAPGTTFTVVQAKS